MKKFEKKEREEFLLEFCRSHFILPLKNTFQGLIDKDSGVIYFTREHNPLQHKKYQHIADFLKEIKIDCLKRIQVFNCSCNKHCLCIPITQSAKLYGYLLFIHIGTPLDKKDLNFIKSLMDISLKEFQKEQELNRLYDTIRPRAIALSTIHTIHRLLTSTLDMDELIERIARLTLQVMRAKHCSIMLFDSSKKYLICKASIDLNNHVHRQHKKNRKIKIDPCHTIGSVAKTGKASLSKNSICVPLVEEDITGVIFSKYKINRAPFNKFDMEILTTLSEQAVIAIKNANLYEEQKRTINGCIKSLSALLDAKSPHTYTHSEQFIKIVLAIAEDMKLPREETELLRYAALLPDTGKFTIPDEILKKKGGLSKNEFSIIKKQHLESLKILKPLEFLMPVMPIIVHHHERYDGTGYPDGLKGNNIPIGARIMAVADAFEAMVSSRPYKDTQISLQEALKEIENNKGTQFDPEVVNAFILVSKKPDFKRLFCP